LILLEICLVKAKTKGGRGRSCLPGMTEDRAKPASYTCTLKYLHRLLDVIFAQKS